MNLFDLQEYSVQFSFRLLRLFCVDSYCFCNKLPGDLKQHGLLSYSSEGQKDKMGFTRLKFKCGQDCVPIGDSREENLLPSLLQLRNRPCSLTHDLLSVFKKAVASGVSREHCSDSKLPHHISFFDSSSLSKLEELFCLPWV